MQNRKTVFEMLRFENQHCAQCVFSNLHNVAFEKVDMNNTIALRATLPCRCNLVSLFVVNRFRKKLKKSVFFVGRGIFAVVSPVTRNGCAQRVYHVDGIEIYVQPIEKSPTERFGRYS